MSFDPVRLNAICHSRLQVIRTILEGYDGTIPFHHYLTGCFKQHRNFGSRDRKIYSAWCYAFFRLGKALPGLGFDQRLKVAWYLVHGGADDLFRFLNEDEIPLLESASIEERLAIISKLYPAFSVSDIFKFGQSLSGDLTTTEYAASMLQQPRTWIRIIRGKEKEVTEELQSRGFAFRKEPEYGNAFSFDPAVKLDDLQTKALGYFEVQDLSSQVAGSMIPADTGEHWWDCCCGAGGKSLELFDRVEGIRITATDSRSSILKNFRERTKRYNSQLSTTVLNLEDPVNVNFFGVKFDGIVADVPCTGSGTWCRNPENLIFFNEAELTRYSNRQKTILTHTLPFLKSKGMLVYITCSVFKKENEDIASWITTLPGMRVTSQVFLNGTLKRSDSMFCAIFLKD